MRRHGLGRRWVVVAIVTLVAACGFGPPSGRQEAPVADEDRLEWAAEEPYFVVVRTACRTLDVYRQGERIRSYPAVFGIGGSKGKLYQGDRRTPTGLYAIVDKRDHPRWHRFLLLDYPNLQDVHRYAMAMESGRIPLLDKQYVGIGGAVGIHGTDKPYLNGKKVDWTFGCISIANEDVEELALLVPVGTPVLIED